MSGSSGTGAKLAGKGVKAVSGAGKGAKGTSSLGRAAEVAEGAVSVPKLRYPGNDSAKAPGPGYEWRGSGTPESGRGNWYNPTTGESMHPDLSHADPIGPHWDYRDSSGREFRIMPDGSVEPKER